MRVHTDSSAVQMNQELGAKAFATGNRIYYGAGKAPGKDELTAHELTHTIQQGAAQPKRISGPTKPNVQPKITEATKHIGTKKLVSTKAESPDRVKQNARNPSQAQVEETKEEIRRLLSSAGNLVNLIADNPEAFLNNLIGGLKLGFNNFASNIRRHLQNALISWLTGSLGSIQMPPENTPTVKGFFSIALQVLGITWASIRRRAVVEYDETTVQRMEKHVAIFQQVQRRPMELWNHVHQLIQGQQKGIIEEIKTTVVNAVIVQLVSKFISLLTPAAGIQALITIYNILQFFIEQCQQLMELVRAVIDAVKAIAAGKMDGIASSVERALSRSLPVLIGTLAAALGIGSVAARIRGIINRMRQPIDRTIIYFLRTVKDLFDRQNRSNVNRGRRSQPPRRTAGTPGRSQPPRRTSGTGRSQPPRRTSGTGRSQPRPNSGTTSRRRQPTPANRTGAARQGNNNRTPSNNRNQAPQRGRTRAASQLRDGEIGQTQTFRAGSELHRLWIEVTRNKATVMVASDPTPLRTLLNREDVQKLNNTTADSQGRIEQARRILNEVDYDAQALIAALTRANNREAEAKDQEIETAMRQLAEHLKWIFPQLKKAALEIAKAVFGDKPFTYQQMVALFDYVSDRTVRTYIDDWLKNGLLFTNRTQPRDNGALYGFKPENIPPRDAQQRNRIATNEEKIEYYKQILKNAGVPVNQWPRMPQNINRATVDSYRRQMRELVINRFGRKIKSLDEKVLSKIKGNYGAIKGEIFKQWIIRNFSGVEKIRSITFQLPASEKQQKVDADLMQGDTIIEAKSYHAREAPDKLFQMNNYREILENKIPARVRRENGTEFQKEFKKVRYMFSNDEAREGWKDALISRLGNYLELWSPQDWNE